MSSYPLHCCFSPPTNIRIKLGMYNSTDTEKASEAGVSSSMTSSVENNDEEIDPLRKFATLQYLLCGESSSK